MRWRTAQGLPLFPALLALGILAGCAAPVTREAPPGDWSGHRTRLETLTHWTASGKLALRSSEASESATLLWRQRGDETRVQLSGPLGVGSTVLESDGAFLDIRRGDEHRRVDIRSREVILRETGWDLPVAALPAWLRGLPDPDLPIDDLDTDPLTGYLRLLAQDGWRVHYEAYGEFAGYALPTRLSIESGDTRARVLIRRWEAPSPP